MPVTDPISDMLTRIRNAIMAHHDTVSVPASKMKASIAKILKEEGFIQDYRVDESSPSPKEQYNSQDRILRVTWPGESGTTRVWSFTYEGNYQTAFYAGNLPGFQPGVSLEVIEDDGSDGFRKEHADLTRQGL